MSIFLDIEWLLSTLFDASLLSPLSRRQRRLLFLPIRIILAHFSCARVPFWVSTARTMRVLFLSFPGNYAARYATRGLDSARPPRDAYPIVYRVG